MVRICEICRTILKDEFVIVTFNSTDNLRIGPAKQTWCEDCTKAQLKVGDESNKAFKQAIESLMDTES